MSEENSVLWEVKGANKLLEKNHMARCYSLKSLSPWCYQRRCDSAPALQDYKQNLKQLI